MQVNYQDQWELGRAGEHAAIRWYEDEGYTLLGHRQRMRAGEIDAVVEDEDGTVVFVEVKSRRGTAFGAAEAVTSKKLNTMRRCAAQWLDKYSQDQYRPIRFDVVEVVFDGEDYILRRFPGWKMALASTMSATVEGVAARLVTVEANVGAGLPGMHMVGLGDAAVKESRERIRTAISNSALPWPRTKIMVSLSPAHLPKAGSHFDLPIALAVLGSLDPRVERTLASSMFCGELALDGTLRRAEGVLPMLIAAFDAADPIRTVVVPRANAAEAALLGRREVLVADSLVQVWQWIAGETELESATAPEADAPQRAVPDFQDLAGMSEEREALEVAAAGGHHVMMIGPPGSGKSMLAERLPSILPPMDVQEMVEVTAIHSAAGVSGGGVVATRPFIAPHPSLTRAALIGGGGGTPTPGVVSQAHRGVLFLDEASEIPAGVLDALRIPLENVRCG